MEFSASGSLYETFWKCWIYG